MTVKVTKPALNLREELSSLKKPSGVAGEAMLRAETPQEQFNLIGAGRKNMVINGNFMVSQRANYSSPTAITSTAYRFDRWEVNILQSCTIQDLDYGCRLEATAATSSGNICLRQPIELNGSGEDVLGKTITISALVRSNNTNASIMYYSTSWGTERVTHSGNGEWERLSITFKLPSVNTGGGYSFMPQVGIDGVQSATVPIAVGDYIEVKEVQVELGSVATPFEHRSYGEELALCQRYYQVITEGGRAMAYAHNSTDVMRSVSFPTQMRTAPTLVSASTLSAGVYDLSIANFRTVSAMALNGIYGQTTAATIKYTVSGATAGTVFASYNNIFAFDAEL